VISRDDDFLTVRELEKKLIEVANFFATAVEQREVSDMDQEIPDGYVEGTMLTVGVTHDHDPRYTWTRACLNRCGCSLVSMNSSAHFDLSPSSRSLRLPPQTTGQMAWQPEKGAPTDTAGASGKGAEPTAGFQP
jgi:hypothetical protein